jgi:hypothetical protein
MDGPAHKSDFDWRVYADATCAGLTALIPIPLVDLAFEATFRRRMPNAIARARGVRLTPRDRILLGRGAGGCLTAGGCIMVPIAGLRYLARRLWHKFVYVLAVADSASLVSAYWHRAYLMDHMIRAGHLDEGADADWAILVFGEVIREADTSPLIGLAREVIAASSRVLKTLSLARRRGSAAETEGLGEIFRSHWGAAQRSFETVANRYNELYVRRPQAPDDPVGVPTVG